jgi:hypothetical protein
MNIGDIATYPVSASIQYNAVASVVLRFTDFRVLLEWTVASLQVILRILWNTEAHSCVHKNPSLHLTISQLNYIDPHFKIFSNIIIPSELDSQK